MEDGKSSGQGIYTWPNGNKYIGEFGNNRINGKGVLTFANGDELVGEWVDNKVHGEGTFLVNGGGSIIGVWANNKLTKILIQADKSIFKQLEAVIHMYKSGQLDENEFSIAKNGILK